jgi:soluble lytic murein transglycosylase-like protein
MVLFHASLPSESDVGHCSQFRARDQRLRFATHSAAPQPQRGRGKEMGVRRTAIALISIAGISLTGLAGFIVLVLIIVIIGSSLPGSGNIPGILQLLPSFGNLQACAPNDTTGPEAVQASAEADSIPENYLEWYVETGRKQNIPWEVLAGIGKIESDHGRSTLRGVHSSENYAGAGGVMQFIKSSWKEYKADGDGDGEEDRYNPADAILGAANHLRGSIGKKSPSIRLNSEDIIRAVHLYNPGDYRTPQKNPYVRDVLAVVNQYDRSYTEAPANYAGVDCAAGGLESSQEGARSFGQRIAYAAAYYARKDSGTPPMPERRYPNLPVEYAWGGGTLNGPSRGFGVSPGGYRGVDYFGFDCSGLAQHAVYKASNGKVVTPDTTSTMWPPDGNWGVRVSREELPPGDLVFFNADVSHMGIYYGEYNGKRWFVEAPATNDDVKFSDFDARLSFAGAIRVSQSPGPIRAMFPSGAGVGEGAT